MDQMVRRQAAIGPADGVGRQRGGHASAAVPAAPAVPAGAAASGAPAGSAVPAVPVVSRKRGKALEAAIFDAALELLTSGGFARMTMEGVAGAAQTGKAALYRRWASKADLVMDALDATLPPPTAIPDLGSVRGELLQVMQVYASVMNSRVGNAMRVLMAELDHEQAKNFREFLQGRVLGPSTSAVLAVLRRGAERGDVRPGAADPLVADVVPAMMLYRAKLCTGRIDREFCERLVDEVLVPLVRP
ncbi:TetR/AcrR family transcriptional regulator [Kitasatospora terrestris]|uniref:TetR/AcrR family transcriptional regulator n=1 Tax=Kitasatospora terrestris TaxID=258051 RepID=A0ABP9E1T4_9ACTN